jgi:uncharacterized protein (TIGR03437 family)
VSNSKQFGGLLKFAILFLILTTGSSLLLLFYTPHGKARQRQSRAQLPTRAQARQRTAELAARYRELQTRLRDPHFLLTRAALFDPLANTPAAVNIGATRLETVNLPTQKAEREQSSPTNTTGYYIVQFKSAIQPAWAEALRARGGEIIGYLPNHAYLVKASTASIAQTQRVSEVRWIGTYGPGLKVAPELVELAKQIANTRTGKPQSDNGVTNNLANISHSGSNSGSDSEEEGAEEEGPGEFIQLSLLSFRDEKATGLRDVLNTLPLIGAPVIEERYDSRIWSLLAVQRAALPETIIALANLSGLEWIEERHTNRLHNDNLVRVVQTGFGGSDTPLYRNGLTGMGQIYGTADSGLDGDHAQFRLSGDAAAQTLSLATTTASLTNGLLPSRITNQSNKVLSYFLLGSSGFKELKDNPNGGQTLDPTRQSGSRYLNAVAYDDNGAGFFHGTLTTSVAVGRNYGANGSGAVPGITTRSTGDGVAPDARIVFQDVGHPSGQLPGVDSVSQALLHQQAYSAGVRVHNNSYGPEPPAVYDQNAADVDDAMWRLRDYTVFFSAGNRSAGDFQVTNAAKNNLVIGACDSPTGNGNLENLASYSNHGPTFDGRIKPDLVASGTVIGATENSSDQNSSSYNHATSATAKDAAVNPDDPNNNSTLLDDAISGTSFAAAAAAGSALLVRQYFTDGYYPNGARSSSNTFTPSNALIKAVLINSGRNLTGRFTSGNFPISASGPLPNFGQGWGRIALDDALYFTGDRRELKVLADIYNGATASETARPAPNPAITTGQTHSYQLTNVSNVEPLRLTLAWSDPRAAVGAIVALVNNLNLEVVAPDGTTYRGNVNFVNAYSQPANGAPFDNRNPIEAVYIQNPIPGTYTVRVIGENVPGNGQTQIIAQPGDQRIDSNRQGYALIATGNFTAGTQPVLNLAASSINGGVNGDPYISRNETVTATVTLNNPSTLAAQNVSIKVEVDEGSQVPASSILLNGQAAGAPITLSGGDVVAGASKSASFQITLLDDGAERVGQTLLLKVTMTPANGLPFVTRFSTRAQLKLVTYRTRFESAPDPGGAGIIAIPEAAWKKRTDHENRAKEKDPFDSDWKIVSLNSGRNGSTQSLSDPSGAHAGYGVGETSRSDGQVYDDARWWSPKIPLPGLFVNEATGLVSNPENAAKLKAEIDSFEVDVKSDFSGDVPQSSSSGDFFILRVRTYDNSVSVRSANDSGATEESFTNLLYLTADNVTSSGFEHYSGNNFASGDGVFNYDEDEADADTSDVFFRLELQFRRNGFPQTGDGVFVDNLVLRLRVADTAVYASPTAGTLATVNAASYERAIAPGQIVAAFGSGLAAGTNLTVAATSVPLPAELGGVSLRVNGMAAPLFFVSANNGAFQINYQLPFETAAGVAQVEVSQEGKLAATEYLVVSDVAPGVFTMNATGSGQAVALNQDYSRNSNTRPAARGSYLIVYATGQGRQLLDATTRQLLRPPSGYPAPANGPLHVTAELPTMTIGGVQAQVDFSGLAPGLVGLWQLNVLIPNNAPTGAAVPLLITSGELGSRATAVAVN